MMNDFGMMGTMGLGWIGLLLVVGIAVALAFVLARRAGTRDTDGSARAALDRRYANGEIGRDEYEQKRRDLA